MQAISEMGWSCIVNMIEKALEIEGWMSTKELLWLANTASKCNVALEVGSFRGRSSRAIGDNIKQVLCCVDPWTGKYLSNDYSQLVVDLDREGAFRVFHHNLKDLIESAKVLYFNQKFQDFETERKFDFIFLDGDHHYEEVKRDIEKALTLITKGGILAGHDYNRADWPGVKQAVDEIFGNTIGVEHTIWWVVNE